MATLERFLLISAIVLFLLVFYRWLLRYLRRNAITEPYPYLYPFEATPQKGSILLKLDIPQPTHLRCELRSGSLRAALVLHEGDLSAGNQQLSLPLAPELAGSYDLCLVFPNQLITRPISIAATA